MILSNPIRPPQIIDSILFRYSMKIEDRDPGVPEPRSSFKLVYEIFSRTDLQKNFQFRLPPIPRQCV